MSNIENKKKPAIKVDTKCCRTCRYVKPIKKVQFSCLHPSKIIYIKGRGDISLRSKWMVYAIIGKQTLCLLSSMTKTCTSCHTTLPLSRFYRERDGAQGVKGKCKPCTDAIKRDYKEKSKRMGICITCTKPSIPGRINCIKHTQTVNIIRQKQTQKRRDENRCVTCGIPLHYQMDKGFVACLNCREHR